MDISYSTENSEEPCWQWVVRFLKFHRHGGEWRHPRVLPASAVAEFLSDLSVRLQVAAATQNQALNALVFLYGEVLKVPLPEAGGFERVRRPARLPEVLSRDEVRLVLAQAAPGYQLPLRLLDGTGMRLMELLRLRGAHFDTAPDSFEWAGLRAPPLPGPLLHSAMEEREKHTYSGAWK